MSNSPLVSVIVPCYNQAIYLPKALQSVEAQFYTNWECIIVNDGSPDNTEEVALEWCKKDNRFRYLKKENGGLSSARNAGLKKAQGEFIQFLDNDDIIEREKLSLSVSAYLTDTSNDIVFTDYLIFHECNSSLESPKIGLENIDLCFENILLEWDKSFNIPIHCALFKSKIFEYLTFKEDIGAKEDWIIWLQMFKKIKKYALINKPLAIYRKHGSNMTENKEFMYENTARAFDYIMKNIINDNYGDFFSKANLFWKDQILYLLYENKNQRKQIYNSTSFKLGYILLTPLRYIKDTYFQLSLKFVSYFTKKLRADTTNMK